MTVPTFAPQVVSRLVSVDDRIVITGAGGWIGMATLELLRNSLGPAFALRVKAFGSSARALQLRDGTVIDQSPLSDLAHLPPAPTILLHTAFLTKDCAERMSETEYVQANEKIRATVVGGLDRIGVYKLFLASSGAAQFAADGRSSAPMRLYGSMKLQDEAIFAQWARNRGATLVIARLFALSGPYINKPATYALASFILDALEGRAIQIRATHPVVRGYVAIREVMSLVFAMLLKGGSAVRSFATGGRPVELGDAAALVADVLGGSGIERPRLSSQNPDRYAGDDKAYQGLLRQFGIPHVSFQQQVVETAEFLAAGRTVGEAIKA